MISKKVLAVIRREYVTRVRTKGFIIGTILFPAILVLIFGGVFIFAQFFQPSTKHFYILDRSGMIATEFTGMFPDTLNNGEPKYIFTIGELPEGTDSPDLAAFQKMIVDKEIDGYIYIPHDILTSRQVRYSARSVSNFDEQQSFSRALSRIVTNYRLMEKGLSPSEIRAEFSEGRVQMISSQITEKGELEKSGVSSFVLTYLLTYILLLLMMIYGQMLMRSVIEEKSQRITETIISSIKPRELMMGKITGICILGLTQLFIIGLFFLVIVIYSEPLFIRFGVTAPQILDIVRQLDFSTPVFLFMLVFFLLGFVFYSTLFATIGAMVNTEDEGQQFQIPVVIVIVVGYFIMIPVIQNPETSMAMWASLIPFFTPVVMFARIAVSDPVIPSGATTSIVIMVVSIALLITFTAKIYRVGILMYGKKPSLKEAVRWLRYR